MDVVCNGEGEIPVMDLVDGINSKVDRAGDTMTGCLIVPADCTGTSVIQSDEINTRIDDAIGEIEDSGIKLGPEGDAIITSDDTWIANQCAAWVTFRGNTSPPQIKDSFNVSSVSRTSTGYFVVNFTEPMDDVNLAVVGMSWDSNLQIDDTPTSGGFVKVRCKNENNSNVNPVYADIVVFGRKII